MNAEQSGRLTQVLFYGALLLIGWLLYLVCRPFLVPLAWAGVLAICWWPVHARVAARFRPGLAAGLSTATLALLLIVPAVLLGIALAQQASGAVDRVQQAFADGPPEEIRGHWHTLQAWVPLPLPPFDDLAETASTYAKEAAGLIARQAGGILGAVLVVLFDVAIVVFALFFILRDGPAIGDAIRRLVPLEEAHRRRLIAAGSSLRSAT